MFNLGNIIKAVVTVAAVANTVIRKVAESNSVVARAVKTFDNFVSSFTGSGKDDNDASDVLSLAERKQREKDRKQQELEQKAKAFDSDIAQAKVGDDLQDEGNLLLAKARHKGEIRKDIDALLQGKLTSAELQVAAVGNPVLQSMLKMWQFERSHFDKYMGDADTIEKIKQKLVASFALAEEDTAEITEAAQYYKYKMGQDVPTEEFTQLQLEVIDLLSPNDPVVQEWRFDPSSVSMYEYMMEQAFGYEIKFAPDQTDESKRQQLDRLAQSNLEIIRYLDEVRQFGRENSLPVTNRLGLFRQVFGENGNVVIHLGANDTQTGGVDTAGNPEVIGAFEGLTPQGSNDIFLGSHVTAATITHEFGHQLDRYRDTQRSSFVLSSDSNLDIMSFGTFLRDVAVNTLATDDGFTLSGDLADRILRARANAASDSPEIFADIFMTAVLNNRGFTIQPEGNNQVGFTDTTNARDVECAFRQYLLQTLSGIPVTRDSYLICEDE